VTLRKAKDALHRAMCIAPCQPGGTVIKIAGGFDTFSYIVENSVPKRKFIMLSVKQFDLIASTTPLSSPLSALPVRWIR
jgi:hypothetical protein